MRLRRPHRPRLGRSSRSGRPAHRHAPGSRQQYGASSSPQKLLSGTHRVDDDDCGDASNVANLENKGSPVGSQEHGETISHVPGPDGVVIGVKDVGLAQAVLQRRSGNDRIVHRSKVTCDALFGRGVRSRGGAGGCCRFDCSVSVRMPQMCWLTSASSAVCHSDAAGVDHRPAAGGCVPRRLTPCPCRRSLSALGMDCGQAGLSQSDSRLGDVELTEFDSTTILSAYDST